MEKNVTNNIKLIDLDDALTILFITLKLCGVIDWSWWLVLLPTIITTGFSLATVAVVGIIFGGVAAKEKIEDLIFDAKLRKLGKGKTKRNKSRKLFYFFYIKRKSHFMTFILNIHFYCFALFSLVLIADLP